MESSHQDQGTAQRSCIAVASCLALFVTLQAQVAFAQATAPGFTITTFASVPDPLKISFAPNGELYVGRNPAGSPAGFAKIHRIGASGSPVVEYGPSFLDPDAVLFDANGSFAPIPGSVIVGGSTSGSTAAIHVIEPGGAGSTIIGPTTLLDNPSDMTFDGSGNLLFTDHGNQDVKVTSGGTPTTLLTLSSKTLSVAYDPVTDRIYSNALDGTIRIHQSNGTLIDAAFATSDEAITVGPGSGVFGNDVYTANSSSGELIRIDLAGNATVIGTGFGAVRDLEFGPDGALYASEADNHRILRIAPIPSIPLLSTGGRVALTILLSTSAWWIRARETGRACVPFEA